MSLNIQSKPVSPPLRDTVRGVSDKSNESPTIVSISDIHGYLKEARSALLTLSDHPGYDSVVTTDEDGRLHWANNDYVLVFNGDLIDRGPQNEATVAMVSRLINEAPQGRVRVTLGNHESMILMSKDYEFVDWYSTALGSESRKQFLHSICEGHVIAAYDGYNYTYAHAGATVDYSAKDVNRSLVEVAEQLLPAVGTMEDSQMQTQLASDYDFVLSKGGHRVKGPSAGLVWMDYTHLSPDSPPQVVGHTRHGRPNSKGNVHCQDVLQDNLGSEGGEGVFIETPKSLTALIREPNNEVKTTLLD